MTMVERVARAICVEAGGDPDHSEPLRMKPGATAQIDVMVRRWQNYRPHARAAIEAMRDPTEAMADAIGQEMDAYLGAIDAALKD